MKNFKLTIEYDGTNFNGWQKQQSVRTIQGEIESVLEKILKEKVKVIGSGRTDAGVHALAQVANFKTDKKISAEELQNALNTLLSPDVIVIKIEEESTDFNARTSAKSKAYRYVVNNNKFPSALNVNKEYHFKYNLDVDVMKMAAQDIIGKHDFKAFMASGSSVKDTKKEIYNIGVNRLGGRIIIDITGSGFLYNMVRIIVGTLLDIGSGKLDICTMKNMINLGDRTLGGKTVGPEGLYLVEVVY